jgi:hypothetical protein
MNAAAVMGETVVLGWVALELTNSPFLVGVAMGARAIPLLLVGVPAGVVADRFPRQRVLVLTGAGQALIAAVLGALALIGALGFGALVLLTFGAGTLRALEHAARQSYAHDVTGARELMNGLALLGVGMRAGWLVGSLAAGALLAHVGTAAGYFGVALGFAAGAVALLLASPAAADPAAGAAGARGRGAGAVVAALGKDRTLLALMALTAGAEMLGFSHQALLPSLARDVLRTGPEGLGVLNAARSIGGILGLFAVAAGRPAGRAGALFVGVLAVFGASLMALGLAPHYVGIAGVVAVLVLVNAAGALTDLLAQGLMQLSVPGRLRGRAGGAWVVAIGLAPVGQLQIGAVASLFGVSVALGASGLGLLALASGTALFFPRVRRL